MNKEFKIRNEEVGKPMFEVSVACTELLKAPLGVWGRGKEMKREEEIKAKGKRQRAKGKERRAESQEQRAESKGQRAESLIAVDFSQRIKKYNVRIGLQPHSMWLKPVFACSYTIRQLKQTAKDTALRIFSAALSFAVEFIQRIKEISSVIAGFVCGISPLVLVPIHREVRGSAGIGMTTIKEISLVMRLAVQNRLALSLTNKSNFNSFSYTAPSKNGGQFIRSTGNRAPADKFFNN